MMPTDVADVSVFVSNEPLKEFSSDEEEPDSSRQEQEQSHDIPSSSTQADSKEETTESSEVTNIEAKDRAAGKKKAAKKKCKKNVFIQDADEHFKDGQDSASEVRVPGSSDPEQWAKPVQGLPEVPKREVAPETIEEEKKPLESNNKGEVELSEGSEDVNVNLKVLKLFQDKRVPSREALQMLLQQRADPNFRYEQQFELHGPVFADGCPLQLGVNSGDLRLVQLLIEYRGDIHTSTYSKKAGASQVTWCGNAPFAALPSDNVEMLKLLVESHNVSSNLTSYLGDKPGASLLWNSSYFGALKCTRYLLEVKAAISKTAPFQDIKGLNYAPLHVAARVGNEKCCELLLDFAADINEKSEVEVPEKSCLKGAWFFTPLDAAIEMSQIAVVKLLLKKKADLIIRKDSSKYQLTSENDQDVRIRRYDYSLQSLLRSGNSRVISEVAKALQDSWHQVTLLTVQDIVRFLKTPGEAPVNLMKALFYESGQIKYWQKQTQGDPCSKGKHDTYFRSEYILAVDPGPKRVYTHAANIQKILVYGQAQYVINFTEGPSKEDVESHWKSNGKATEEDIPSFVARLAPQPAKEKSWRRLFEKIVEVERVFLPVNFFACLVPNLHRSEKVLLAVATCPNQEIFRLRECEAIVSFNWTTVKYTQLFDLAIQALTSLLALLCISTLRDEAPEWCGSLTIFAGLGLPLVVLTILMRLGEVIGNEIRKAWDMYLEILLHLATLVLFSVFLSKGQVTCSDRGVIDNLWMRAFIIVVSSLRLMCCCDMLRLAYSEVNMIVTPIVSALAKSLPFCIAVIYFAFIMWQAYWTLDVEEWQNGWKAVIIAWRFAILGDFEVDELEGQEGTWHQVIDNEGGTMLTYEDPELTKNATVVRGVFILLCGIMFPVLIMNILISVLSVWLDFAIKNVWLDFQQARARRVLRYKAMTYACRRRQCCLRPKDKASDGSASVSSTFCRAGEKPSYIWFSAPKEEEVLHQDVEPGLNLKFKEVTEGAQKLDSRLKELEKNMQILVDTTTKNERRRAKQTFDKAFTPQGTANPGFTA
ncbi:unnamed protein product [Durusdinium trenchii]|uniref:Ion transport domain-containing protein n=2 Tax=Durusdinium trenchii TaxID=1381693 RepID=A0ABP0KHJ2_9DINO